MNKIDRDKLSNKVEEKLALLISSVAEEMEVEIDMDSLYYGDEEEFFDIANNLTDTLQVMFERE